MEKKKSLHHHTRNQRSHVFFSFPGMHTRNTETQKRHSICNICSADQKKKKDARKLALHRISPCLISGHFIFLLVGEGKDAETSSDEQSQLKRTRCSGAGVPQWYWIAFYPHFHRSRDIGNTLCAAYGINAWLYLSILNWYRPNQLVYFSSVMFTTCLLQGVRHIFCRVNRISKPLCPNSEPGNERLTLWGGHRYRSKPCANSRVELISSIGVSADHVFFFFFFTRVSGSKHSGTCDLTLHIG